MCIFNSFVSALLDFPFMHGALKIEMLFFFIGVSITFVFVKILAFQNFSYCFFPRSSIPMSVFAASLPITSLVPNWTSSFDSPEQMKGFPKLVFILSQADKILEVLNKNKYVQLTLCSEMTHLHYLKVLSSNHCLATNPMQLSITISMCNAPSITTSFFSPYKDGWCHWISSQGHTTVDWDLL